MSVEDAEVLMLDFLEKHTVPKESPLAGNSIHVDRKFLEKFMPRVIKHLHYRIIDTASLKELTRRYPHMNGTVNSIFRWFPAENHKQHILAFNRTAHRALDDVKDCIKELQWYRENIFIQPSQTTSPTGQAEPTNNK
jgi:oligoribonuclease